MKSNSGFSTTELSYVQGSNEMPQIHATIGSYFAKIAARFGKREALVVRHRAFCQGQVAHYKVPRYAHSMEIFPLTVSGKVRKSVLREQVARTLKRGEVAA